MIRYIVAGIVMSGLLLAQAPRGKGQVLSPLEDKFARRHRAAFGAEATVVRISPANGTVGLTGDAEGRLSRIDLDQDASDGSGNTTAIVAGCAIQQIDYLDDRGQVALATAQCEEESTIATLLTRDGGSDWEMMGVHALATTCQASLSFPPFHNNYAAGGETSYLNLNTQGSCASLLIRSTESFIGGLGHTSNRIPFTVARNVGPSNRVGFIVAGTAWAKLVQLGTGNQQYPYWVAVPYGCTAPRAGGGINASINAGNGVEWQATSDSSWVTINNFLGIGMGNGTLSLSVSANTTGRSRTARITVTGSSSGPLSFNVTQQ